LVEQGMLEKSFNASQLVLLIAVTYHNIAFHQLLMGHIGDACFNSQNARRLARTCLNLGKRYILYFEATHARAVEELYLLLRPSQSNAEALKFRRIIKDFFD